MNNDNVMYVIASRSEHFNIYCDTHALSRHNAVWISKVDQLRGLAFSPRQVRWCGLATEIEGYKDIRDQVSLCVQRWQQPQAQKNAQVILPPSANHPFGPVPVNPAVPPRPAQIANVGPGNHMVFPIAAFSKRVRLWEAKDGEPQNGVRPDAVLYFNQMGQDVAELDEQGNTVGPSFPMLASKTRVEIYGHAGRALSGAIGAVPEGSSRVVAMQQEQIASLEARLAWAEHKVGCSQCRSAWMRSENCPEGQKLSEAAG